MKITSDGEHIVTQALPTIESLNAVYHTKGSALDYIEGSRTTDTLRFGKTQSKLPFEFTFTDRYNYKWEVVVDKMDDDVTIVIPCGPRMLWYGADESPTRTGSDAQTHWASVQFSYQDTTWLPPYHAGVKIAFIAYKDRSAGEWKVDTERWNNILDLAKRGVDIGGAVMDQIEQGVRLVATGGVV